MPHEELLSQIRKKRLGRHHEVSRDGLQWQRAGELQELFEPTIAVLQPAATSTASGMAATSGDGHRDSSAAAPASSSARETSWFYAKDGSRNGPISESELLAIVAAGQLSLTDLVWNEQLESWTPLKQIPKFAIGTPVHPAIMPRESAPTMPSSQSTPPLLTSSLFAMLFACLSLLAIPLIFLLSAVISGNDAFNNALAAQGGSAGRRDAGCAHHCGDVRRYAVVFRGGRDFCRALFAEDSQAKSRGSCRFRICSYCADHQLRDPCPDAAGPVRFRDCGRREVGLKICLRD
jgi:hypothetical protein